MERYLWGAVVLLVGCVVVLAYIVMNRPTISLEAGTAPLKDQVQSARGSSSDRSSSKVIAQIANQSITAAQLAAALDHQYGSSVLQQQLTDRAIALEASSLHITVSDAEVDAAVRREQAGYSSAEEFQRFLHDNLGLTTEQFRDSMKKQLLLDKLVIRRASIQASAVQDYIRNHADQFQSSARFNISQIIVETFDKAEQILQQLAGGADFGELATQYSTDSYSAEQGGSLGQIDQHDPFIDKQVLQAASELQVGAYSAPVKLAQGGYAIILLAGKDEAVPMDQDEAEFLAKRAIASASGPSTEELKQQLLHKYGAVILDEQYAAQ